MPLRQCSFLGDHILVEHGSADYWALVSAGYNCSLDLGHPWRIGSGPSGSDVEWANVCPVWRFNIPGVSHFFTRGADSLVGMDCEPPARFEAATNSPCFVGTPSGC